MCRCLLSHSKRRTSSSQLQHCFVTSNQPHKRFKSVTHGKLQTVDTIYAWVQWLDHWLWRLLSSHDKFEECCMILLYDVVWCCLCICPRTIQKTGWILDPIGSLDNFAVDSLLCNMIQVCCRLLMSFSTGTWPYLLRPKSMTELSQLMLSTKNVLAETWLMEYLTEYLGWVGGL